jgi:SAM-dependent methyltransferase
MSLFCCPDCRGSLSDWFCAGCGVAYAAAEGIPDLLGTSALAQRYRQIAAHYDALYLSRTDVWREQGHTDAFTKYVVDLVEAAGQGRYLDVGCGEGFFLRAARRMEGFGIDLSRQALMRARASSGATVAVAAAERLPFVSDTFDVVTSIGAMEHFVDDWLATSEIRRVLKPRGRYILALLIEITRSERFGIKAREFLWPRPRPFALASWLIGKLRGHGPLGQPVAFPQQPVQNRYRSCDAQTLFRRSGFRVARRITVANAPGAPLPGHYMRFYCLEAI